MGVLRNGDTLAGMVIDGGLVGGIIRNGNVVFRRALQDGTTPPVASPYTSADEVATNSGVHIREFTATRYPMGDDTQVTIRVFSGTVYYFELERRIGIGMWNRIDSGTIGVGIDTEIYQDTYSDAREYRLTLYDFQDHRIQREQSAVIQAVTAVPAGSKGGIREFSYVNNNPLSGFPDIRLTAIFNNYYSYTITRQDGEVVGHGTATSVNDFRALPNTFYVLRISGSGVGVVTSTLGTAWLITTVETHVDHWAVTRSSLGNNRLTLRTDGEQDYFYEFQQRSQRANTGADSDTNPWVVTGSWTTVLGSGATGQMGIDNEAIHHVAPLPTTSDGPAPPLLFRALIFKNNNGVKGNQLERTTPIDGIQT